MGEDIRKLPFNDVLSKLEKLEIIHDKNSWFKLREIRNELAHEYPEETDESVDILNLLFESVDGLFQITERVLAYALTYTG